MELDTEKEIARILISKGEELSKQPYEAIKHTKNDKANEFLNNLENNSHAFVLACIMDRKIKAERAWLIPYRIAQEIDSYNFSALLKLSKEEITDIFVKNNLHFYNNQMVEIFI